MKSHRIEELELLWEKSSSPQEKINLLTDMGVEARNYNTQLALEYAERIITESEKENYRLGLGKGYNLKGSVLNMLGEYDEGIGFLGKAGEIAEELGNTPLRARVQNNMGNVFRDQGDFASALSYYENALHINESSNDESLLAGNLNNIANLWYEMGDYDTALEYALKCLPILLESQSNNRLKDLYNTLGNVYFKKDMYTESKIYFDKILEMTGKQTTPYQLANTGVAKIFFKTNQIEEAVALFKEILLQANNMEMVEVQIICKYYLGLCYLQEESFRKAKLYLEEAYDVAKDYTRRHDMLSIHEALSQLYDEMGNVPKAFEHLKSFERLKEEVFQQTTFNKLRNLQLQQQTELANKEREVAERTAQLKQQFMANMSHEIRTLMNAIVGMTRLLLGKEPKQDQVKYLEAIAQSADNLLVIINDILDVSKIEAGKIIIEQVPFKLRDVLNNLRDILILKAEEKELQLLLKIEEQIPDNLIGDPSRLNQILVNLIGNAIKFTEQGGIEIKVSETKKDQTKVYLQFDVIDTGIGISEDYVTKIFDSFTQAGTDTARKYGGTGLGLTISKQLTELMHGNIEVSSELGKGTTFTVHIPFEENLQVSNNDAHELLEAEAREKLKGIKVLLVEDNEFNRMVAEDTLRDAIENIMLDVAVNGAEAVEKVKAHKYDVVLMDIQMPIMNGMDATKAIRQLSDHEKSKTQIIAMTANVLQDDVKHYFEIGMNGYVAKPFQTIELMQRMVEAIGKANQAPAPEKAEEPKPNRFKRELPSVVTDMNFLRQLTGGNSEKMHKYITMFLQNGPQLLATIKQSLAQQDYPSIKIAAHSMKPQLSYMGVKEELSNVFMLEQAAGEQGHYEKIPELIENLEWVTQKAFKELEQFAN